MDDQRLGIMFSDRPRVDEQIAVARLADEAGYSSVWVGETRLSRDAVSILGALAARTERIRLGAAIINTWTRGPVLTALTFATLDELAPRRIILGLGTYSDPLAHIQGIERHQPLQQMREYVSVVRRLFAIDEAVTMETQHTRVRGAKLELGYELSREPIKIPIYIGATLPRMMEVAGEIADGVLLNAFMDEAYSASAIQRIRTAAERAGRTASEVDIAQFIPIAMSEDEREARATARRVLAMYLGGQPHVARAAGIGAGLAAELRSALGGWPPPASGVEAAMRLITNDLVDALTIAAPPDECHRRLRERANLGISHPIIFPLLDNAADVCRTFAPLS
jgi:5,10-methylenetetrahydromethanopterin reductase